MTGEPNGSRVTGRLPDLPPPPGAAVHRRSIIMDSYLLDDEHVTVIGRLTDQAPGSGLTRETGHGRQVIHDMALTITVRLPDLMITSAEAGMTSFPHTECPLIAPAFAQLAGLSVRRGFTRELRQRLGGVSGCAHLGELARAMGPAVVRTAGTRRPKPAVPGDPGLPATGPAPLPLGTCHVWAPDGVGMRKIEAGWVPGTVAFPVPPLADFT